MVGVVLLVVIAYIAVCVLIARTARRKGRSYGLWFCLAFFISPATAGIAVLAMSPAPAAPAVSARRPSSIDSGARAGVAPRRLAASNAVQAAAPSEGWRQAAAAAMFDPGPLKDSLERILEPGEEVVATIVGFLGLNFPYVPAVGPGMLALTTSRVVFVELTATGRSVRDLSLDRIASIENRANVGSRASVYIDIPAGDLGDPANPRNWVVEPAPTSGDWGAKRFCRLANQPAGAAAAEEPRRRGLRPDQVEQNLIGADEEIVARLEALVSVNHPNAPAPVPGRFVVTSARLVFVETTPDGPRVMALPIDRVSRIDVENHRIGDRPAVFVEVADGDAADPANPQNWLVACGPGAGEWDVKRLGQRVKERLPQVAV